VLASEGDEGKAIRVGIAKAKEWAQRRGLPTENSNWD
jgi:hypothetical protein